MTNKEKLSKFTTVLPYFIFIIFFIAYSTLGIIRHLHYESFGYDLGINDQVVWRYSTFQAPLTTIGPFSDKIKLYEHIEIVYALVAPFYWIWSNRRMLILVQAAIACSGSIALYLLGRNRKLKPLVNIALMISYLTFYGLQNALWFDVHSNVFATGFLAWFIYFLDTKKIKRALVFFLLAITSKENIALATFLISLVYFIQRRKKITLLLMFLSASYLIFVFFIYFPHIIHFRYLYENKEGLLSNLNPLSLIDTQEKRQTIFYAFSSFGFLPFLMPLSLLPILGHFTTYYILASDLGAAQGIYMHYRVTLAAYLTWATILVISRYKRLNTNSIAIYLLLCTIFMQYFLHLPLSYLSKAWFWQEPSGVKNIDMVKTNYLPVDVSVVSQNNITPHISNRDKIYTLYPEKKTFSKNSPCGEQLCDWFRWDGNPKYLFIDTSPEWDARHLLIDRENYIRGLKNLEKENIIKKYKQVGNAILYTVNSRP